MAILLVVLLLPHTLWGGLGGTVALCLGGGHHVCAEGQRHHHGEDAHCHGHAPHGSASAHRADHHHQGTCEHDSTPSAVDPTHAHEGPVECAAACEHEGRSLAALTIPVSHHDHRGCGCVDIELDLVDLLGSARDGAVPAPVVFLCRLAAPSSVPSSIVQIVERRDDPGGLHRIVVVRTTRLRT